MILINRVRLLLYCMLAHWSLAINGMEPLLVLLLTPVLALLLNIKKGVLTSTSVTNYVISVFWPQQETILTSPWWNEKLLCCSLVSSASGRTTSFRSCLLMSYMSIASVMVLKMSAVTLSHHNLSSEIYLNNLSFL